MPENGTSVRNWPVLSPAQTQTLIAAHVMTVEDLAIANEEVIMRLGMGGRALKQRAVDWLQAASSTGKTAEQLTALQVENEALKASNAKMDEQLALLKNQVAALMAKA